MSGAGGLQLSGPGAGAGVAVVSRRRGLDGGGDCCCGVAVGGGCGVWCANVG